MAIKREDPIPPDHNHRLECEHIHLALLEEAIRGLVDVRDGRVESAKEMFARERVMRRK